MSRRHTVKGRYCSPRNDKQRAGAESCYTKAQLLDIVAAYNRKYSSKIPTKGTKKELWQAIEQRMDQCNNEWCWMEELGVSGISDTFRPVRPAERLQWLSTTDIRNVLKQYEAIYDDFTFLGPVPIDFCRNIGDRVCDINFASSKRAGKTKIGIVFNTDPGHKPGKHWLSMFIDISHSNPKRHEINYFDSYGMAPMLPEIISLIQKLQKQNPDIKLRLNCNGDLCTHAIRHQRDNTECGMYSINFIVERLTGKPWEELIVLQKWEDAEMIALRKKYFRPARGSQHPD